MRLRNLDFITLWNHVLKLVLIHPPPHFWVQQMSSNCNGQIRQSRGRPSKGIIEKLRAQAWYTEVSSSALGGSDYRLEKRFASPTARQNADGVAPVCSGKWRRYRQGAMPTASVVQEVERALPGARRWLDHPFWEIIGNRPLGLERLHVLMASLRPQVSKILFVRPSAKCPSLGRRDAILTQIRALDRTGDFDALTACLGIAREAELAESNWLHYNATWAALGIFLRIGVSTPLINIADPVFERLRHQFFYRRYGFVPERPDVERSDLLEFFSFYNSIILMMEDLCLLSGRYAEHLAVLYIVQRCKSLDVYDALEAHIKSPNWRAARHHPVIRSVLRRLRTHLASPYAYDGLSPEQSG
jgi:hypothetical protein